MFDEGSRGNRGSARMHLFATIHADGRPAILSSRMLLPAPASEVVLRVVGQVNVMRSGLDWHQYLGKGYCLFSDTPSRQRS